MNKGIIKDTVILFIITCDCDYTCNKTAYNSHTCNSSYNLPCHCTEESCLTCSRSGCF